MQLCRRRGGQAAAAKNSLNGVFSFSSHIRSNIIHYMDHSGQDNHRLLCYCHITRWYVKEEKKKGSACEKVCNLNLDCMQFLSLELPHILFTVTYIISPQTDALWTLLLLSHLGPLKELGGSFSVVKAKDVLTECQLAGLINATRGPWGGIKRQALKQTCVLTRAEQVKVKNKSTSG